MGIEIGPIRPPSEANSLLLRVTRNCPWNKCTFCMLYKQEKFSPRGVKEIKADIDLMYEMKQNILELGNQNDSLKLTEAYNKLNDLEKQCFYMVYNFIKTGQESAFLQDANSIVLSPEKLAEVVRYLRDKFPEIKRITTYARADTLSRLSIKNLCQLKDAGIDRIHSGYESGSDKVLSLVKKGITKEQEIDGGKKVKEAGMELSVYFMPGLGGRPLSEENALETADVMNQINPDFIRIRTFVVKKESEIWYNTLDKAFIECSDIEKLQEIKKMILNLGDVETVIKSDHIINLLEKVRGKMPEDKSRMIEIIEAFERLSPYDQKFYQLARRLGKVRGIEGLQNLSEAEEDRIHHILKEIDTPEAFENMLRDLMNRYI